MNDDDYQKLRAIHFSAQATLNRGNALILDRDKARETLWLLGNIYSLDESIHELRRQADEDQAITRDRLARAWQEGFKQGNPRHDVNFDDPDARARNPYREDHQ